MKRSKLIPVTVGLCVLAGANYWGYRNWYAAPLAEKQEEIVRIAERTESLRKRTGELLASRSDLSEAASLTLGRTVQTTEERLRSTLNELVRSAGLDEVRVDTRVDRNPTMNPASDARLDAYRRRDERGRLRSTTEAAFTRMVATLTGAGDTGSVFEALSLIESQRWLSRVVRLKLDPRDEGARTDFVIEVETILMTDRSPETGPGLSPVDPARAQIASNVLARVPFSAPEPAEPETVVQKPEPVAPKPEPAPSPPPYPAWTVAFLRDGSVGPELTIRRANPSETRVLRIDDRFHGMTFKGFDGLDAIFELEGDRFRIGVGQNLATRDNPEVVQ